MFICFTTKSRDFTKIFKSENLFFLNLYSVHGARILDLSLKIIISTPK